MRIFASLVHPAAGVQTRETFKASPLVRIAASCHDAGGVCPVFIFSPDLAIVQETTYYAGAPLASRFPSFWFLQEMTDPDYRGVTDTQRDALFRKYAEMTAYDFKRWAPPLALIDRGVVGKDEPVDLIGYFNKNPAFAAAFRPYKKLRSTDVYFPADHAVPDVRHLRARDKPMTKILAAREWYFWLFIFTLLVPWIVFSCRLSANSDLLWLGTAMDRILHGGTMTHDAYEDNPPLSMTTALIPLLLSKTGIPFADATTLYAFAGIALAVAAAHRILLTGWPDIDRRQLLLISAGFALGSSIFTSGTNLAERDHLIGLGLVPFMFVQLALTHGRAWPRRTGWAVLLVTAYLILLKPCYGLLPTILIAHRVWYRRNLLVVRDADFIALAAATILCPLVSYLFFPDWFHNILPDVLRYYVTLRDDHVVVKSGWLALIGAGLIASQFLVTQPPASRQLGVWLAFGALINVASFYAQGRDYYYHLLPSAAFFAAAFATLVFPPLEREGGSLLGLFGGGALLTGMAYALIPLDTSFITARQYRDLPLTRMVATCDGMTGKPCTFYLFNDGHNIPWETAYYTHTTFASRIGSLWWLPGLLKNPNITEAQRSADRRRFAHMMAEDLARYQPKLILVGRFGFDGQTFDFPGYFSIDPDFRAAWSHYQLQRQFVWDRRPYGAAMEDPVTVPVDVYHRQPD